MATRKNGGERNTLDFMESNRLYNWLKDKWESIQQLRPEREEIAKQATRELGFTITTNNVKSVARKGGLGEWPVTRKMHWGNLSNMEQLYLLQAVRVIQRKLNLPNMLHGDTMQKIDRWRETHADRGEEEPAGWIE